MGIRAHRVSRFEYDKCSFSLSNEELASFLNLYEQLGEDGLGLVEVYVEDLKKAVEKLDLDPELKESLEDDIRFSKERGEDYIMYYLF